MRLRTIRISDADWAEFHRLANDAGLSVSEYVRRRALDPKAYLRLRRMRRAGDALAGAAGELATLARRLGSR